MASTQQFTLPDKRFRLEEINMPEELAETLVGQTVAVKVLPEVSPRTLRIDLDNPPSVGVLVLVDDDGTAWNDHWPTRLLYTGPEGQEWRLPRRWLSGAVSIGKAKWKSRLVYRAFRGTMKIRQRRSLIPS